MVALLGVWSLVEGRAPRKGRVRQQVDCFSNDIQHFGFKSLSNIYPFGSDRCLAWIAGCVTGGGKAAAGPTSVQSTKSP